MKKIKALFKENLSKILGRIFLIILGIVFYECFFKYSYLFKDATALRDWILSYGSFSVLIFLALQVLQVVAFFIPGEIFQVAGGYIFGAYYGFLLCIIGSIIGGLVNFYIIRKTIY